MSVNSAVDTLRLATAAGVSKATARTFPRLLMSPILGGA